MAVKKLSMKSLELENKALREDVTHLNKVVDDLNACFEGQHMVNTKLLDRIEALELQHNAMKRIHNIIMQGTEVLSI